MNMGLHREVITGLPTAEVLNMAMAAATNTVMDRATAMHDRRRAALEAVSAFQSSDTPAVRAPSLAKRPPRVISGHDAIKS
jgi:hypothetical protein